MLAPSSTSSDCETHQIHLNIISEFLTFCQQAITNYVSFKTKIILNDIKLLVLNGHRSFAPLTIFDVSEKQKKIRSNNSKNHYVKNTDQITQKIITNSSKTCFYIVSNEYNVILFNNHFIRSSNLIWLLKSVNYSFFHL